MIDEVLMVRTSLCWALLLIAITIAIHSIGVVVLAFVTTPARLRLERRGSGLWFAVPSVIGIVVSVGLVLAALHGIEIAVWAVVYRWLGVFASPGDALLYSIGAMTTAGAPGVTLEGHWRMMGALESAGGMLVFGISTAYMFAVLQAHWPILSHRH